MTPIQVRCVLASATSVAEREVDSAAISADGSDGWHQMRHANEAALAQFAGTGCHPATRPRRISASFYAWTGASGKNRDTMGFEKCDECGFSGEKWSDAGAISAIAHLPARFADAVADLSPNELLRRPVEDQWSIAEYTDHVREVIFGMRFLLDMVVSQPGTNLGDSPSSPFEPAPRQIDIDVALLGIEREATSFLGSLTELTPNQWDAIVTLDRTNVDPHWIVRHAVHDSNHHLLDIERLRLAL